MRRRGRPARFARPAAPAGQPGSGRRVGLARLAVGGPDGCGVDCGRPSSSARSTVGSQARGADGRTRLAQRSGRRGGQVLLLQEDVVEGLTVTMSTGPSARDRLQPGFEVERPQTRRDAAGP